MINNVDQCIHCGKCTKSCSFLKKYNMDLYEFSQKNELAYHCFLCGDCKRVCPKNINGRDIALSMRKNYIENGFCPGKNGYRMLLTEKSNYLFQNYNNLKSKKVLFTGCNFPAYYPKLTEKIANELKKADHLSVVYDCCGKPIAELGMEAQEEKILERLNVKLVGVEEITVLCPNCYYYLKPRLDIPIVNIYDKLSELNMTCELNQPGYQMYIPCPDKDTKEILESIKTMFVIENCSHVKHVQCCGAGGCANVKEPYLSKQMKQSLGSESQTKKIYTYCATCTGVLSNEGVEAKHILCDIFDFGEKPAKGISSLINRAVCKFK